MLPLCKFATIHPALAACKQTKAKKKKKKKIQVVCSRCVFQYKEASDASAHSNL